MLPMTTGVWFGLGEAVAPVEDWAVDPGVEEDWSAEEKYFETLEFVILFKILTATWINESAGRLFQ